MEMLQSGVWQPGSIFVMLNRWLIVEMCNLISLFYWYYFDRCSSEPVQVVRLPYFRGKSTHYSDRLHDFSVTITRCYKDVYINSFFPLTASHWDSVPIECFPLTYDLNGLKSLELIATI